LPAEVETCKNGMALLPCIHNIEKTKALYMLVYCAVVEEMHLYTHAYNF